MSLWLTGNSAIAEQSGSATAPAVAGAIDAGGAFTCAILSTKQVRCWGFGSAGRLGYANTNNIGDNEFPGSVGPVNLGSGRTAAALATGNGFACVILDTAQVRCWGYGLQGQLGYASTSHVGDDETPGSVGPVNVGGAVTAITGGNGHTCAILNSGQVRCWGLGSSGQLGYGGTANIGDDETPASVGPVNLGAGRTATAISAGDAHTCAILDTGAVRCWGAGAHGQLGTGSTANVGDDELPASVGPVNLGSGRTATAISSGQFHTCAILDTGSVRCWGDGGQGRLGYGSSGNVGDDESVDAAGPVDLGGGHTATAIAAGRGHTCAILDTGDVRCWGDGSQGRLGLGTITNIGDDESPASVAPVDLGAGETAVAIAAGGAHTCAALNGGQVRCWGDGADGQLGYGNVNDIGDDESPASAGYVSLGGLMFDPGRPPGPGTDTPPPVSPPPGPATLPPPPPGRLAVGPFKVVFVTRAAAHDSSGHLIRIANVVGVAVGSKVSVRCLASCRLDRVVTTTKRQRGVPLRRPVRIDTTSRVRVTVSQRGRVARYRTYAFRRTKARLIARITEAGCATDVRGRKRVKCPLPKKRSR